MFILVNDLSCEGRPNYIWYICDLNYYENPNSDWILQSTETLNKKNAMLFCKAKAVKLCSILSEQVDEEGYFSLWKVEEAEEALNKVESNE